MRTKEGSSFLIPTTVVLGGAAALLSAGLALTVSPRPAQALPKYAAEFHMPCSKCHVNPAGGGARTAYGKAFEENGNKPPK
jgi:mono/diheme cytochrome c family protein